MAPTRTFNYNAKSYPSPNESVLSRLDSDSVSFSSTACSVAACLAACLSHVLGRDSLATTPEAYAAHGGESEEDAEVR